MPAHSPRNGALSDAQAGQSPIWPMPIGKRTRTNRTIKPITSSVFTTLTLARMLRILLSTSGACQREEERAAAYRGPRDQDEQRYLRPGERDERPTRPLRLETGGDFIRFGGPGRSSVQAIAGVRSPIARTA